MSIETGHPKYLREAWYSPTPEGIKKGDYVLASKYRDGDPGDQFCIGFYDSSFGDGTGVRHLVIDGVGQQFRRNGFRRIAKIGRELKEWHDARKALFDASGTVDTKAAAPFWERLAKAEHALMDYARAQLADAK